MKEYHKIQTVYRRDEKTHTLLDGEFSLPEFTYLRDTEWVFTEKIDGTNIRIMWDGSVITFGGKTDNAQIPAFLVKLLQDLFIGPDKEPIFRATFGDGPACLYGEGYGARIQKGGGNYKADGVDFALFDVLVRTTCDLHKQEESSPLQSITTTPQERSGGSCAGPVIRPFTRQNQLPTGSMQPIGICTCRDWWLRREDIEDVAAHFSLVVVPIIGRGTLAEMCDRARGGFDSQWGNFPAEGIVAKPAVELKTRRGNRIITKIKHKDFGR